MLQNAAHDPLKLSLKTTIDKGNKRKIRDVYELTRLSCEKRKRGVL
jgi:hypothetical protein